MRATIRMSTKIVMSTIMVMATPAVIVMATPVVVWASTMVMTVLLTVVMLMLRRAALLAQLGLGVFAGGLLHKLHA